MVYFNDIIIYLENEEEYREHIKQVLKRLQEEQILVIIKKCEFFTRKTNFVKFIIKLGQLSIDLKKIKAIRNWQELKNVIQLKSFLGFCNYCKRFIA